MIRIFKNVCQHPAYRLVQREGSTRLGVCQYHWRSVDADHGWGWRGSCSVGVHDDEMAPQDRARSMEEDIPLAESPQCG
jgi:hypothetical protein